MFSNISTFDFFFLSMIAISGLGCAVSLTIKAIKDKQVKKSKKPMAVLNRK